MSIIQQANDLTDVYESLKDKMTGSEKLHMDLRFTELDQMIAEGSREDLKQEVISEITEHLEALKKF